ncbi:MAG: ribosome biogenesis GTPase Der [Deltaproteobacteria bacterium]|jgi:small GTP-binding protein|nr:ribosome biogenesis GTPase Der [Deltaproteobacteria bacterium]
MCALIAILGRPNVGKSSLFNRLARRSAALVDDRPGVTRDRHYADFEIDGRRGLMVDTGGFDAGGADPLAGPIAEQIALALEECDLALLVTDAIAGLRPEDGEIARLARRSGKPVIVAANKTDSPEKEPLAHEFHELGFDELFPVSAAHGYGIGALKARLRDFLEPVTGEPARSGRGRRGRGERGRRGQNRDRGREPEASGEGGLAVDDPGAGDSEAGWPDTGCLEAGGPATGGLEAGGPGDGGREAGGSGGDGREAGGSGADGLEEGGGASAGGLKAGWPGSCVLEAGGHGTGGAGGESGTRASSSPCPGSGRGWDASDGGGTEEEGADRLVPRLAVIGRPNAGKSSLINRLCGQSRLVTDARPGTTRDALDVEVESGGRRYVFVDTAGVRRRGRVSDRVEKISVMRALKSLDRADAALLLIDATEGLADQDAHIAGYAFEKGRPIVILLNKWDLVRDKKAARAAFERDLAVKMSYLEKCPWFPVSAKTGRGLDRVFPLADRIMVQFNFKASTSEVNRVLEEATARHSPPQVGKTRLKFYYATQAGTGPPSFVLFANRPKSVHFSYKRFLANRFREAFGLDLVPARLFIRGRRPGDDGGDR